MDQTPPRRAFTLVEILLVLAIIVILMFLFLPILFGAKDQAQKTHCLSNLRQIGLAMRMYGQDHDETYPPGAYQSTGPTPNGSWDTSWHDCLRGYFQNKDDAFFCPSVSGPRYYRRSYGANPWVCRFQQGTMVGTLESNPRVMIAEKNTGDWAVWPRSAVDTPTHDYLTERHRDRLQVLYTDGRLGTATAFELSGIAGSWIPKP